MGYRGKLAEQDKARELRATGMTLLEIADALGVAKSSVSLWVRDVAFEPQPRRRAVRRAPNALQLRKQAEIDELQREGLVRLGTLSDQAFLAAGAALYAGEGAKRDGSIRFANTDPTMMRFFCDWLRHYFEIDERRLRVRLYLHDGLDLSAAVEHWSDVTGVPPAQFGAPYRAVTDSTMRHNKHEFGCATLVYNSSRTHRAIIGLTKALLSSNHLPG